MRNSKRFKILLSVLLTVLLLVTATTAWFFTNNDVTIDYGSTIQCEAGDSLEISLDGGETWHNSISFTNVSPRIIDISGNGLNLYRPNVITENGIPQNFSVATAVNNVTGEGDYIEMEVMLRSVSQVDVFFSGESAVTPNSETDEGKNIYGNFSMDYIAGAMRIAVVEKNGDEETLKMIWAPNPEYQLAKDETNGKYYFEKNGVYEDDYRYYGSADGTLENLQEIAVTAEQYANKQFVLGSTNSDISMAGGSPLLTSLDTKNADGTLYQKTIIIRVWFEGTDREAHQALGGGWAKMLFKFNGMKKSTDTEKQAKIDDLTCEGNQIFGLESGMYYSEDGRTWTEYTTSSSFTTGKTYFFKYPETSTHYETSCKSVTVG